jgi:hypothetical protein
VHGARKRYFYGDTPQGWSPTTPGRRSPDPIPSALAKAFAPRPYGHGLVTLTLEKVQADGLRVERPEPRTLELDLDRRLYSLHRRTSGEITC